MKTEDDTFKKLKQIPFSELLPIVKETIHNLAVYDALASVEKVDEYFAQYGWTCEEINKALAEHYKTRS